VYDSQQKLLYRDPTSLTPKLGQVDYRLIIHDDSADACTPPPPSADSPPPVTSVSAKQQVKNVASTAKVVPAPTPSGKADPATPAASVTLPAIQPASAPEAASASSSGTKAPTFGFEKASTGPTALVSRFITENYPRIEHELSAGPVTKTLFLQYYGNSTAVNGDTISNLLASLPDDSVFASADAISDALAQREAQTLQASSGVATILAQAFGATTPAEPLGAVTVDKFVAIPANVRKSLRTVGIKTVGDLATATSAVLSRVAAKLKQNNVPTSLGDLAQLAGQAKVLVRLQ
jgi:hypothetical protein